MAIQRKAFTPQGMMNGIPPPPDVGGGGNDVVTLPSDYDAGPLSPGTGPAGPPSEDGHLPPIPGSSEGPRDRPMPQPPTENAPGGVTRKGLPGAAPPMPMSPTPVSAQPPQPFTPLTPPRGMSGAALAPSSNLLGKAGGLLGGGLGVPGIASGDTQDVSSLIESLLANLRGGQ